MVEARPLNAGGRFSLKARTPSAPSPVLTNQDLASRVGLTPAPCLRRVRRLEGDGVIVGYRAILDSGAMGRSFEVIVNADLVAKDAATVAEFEQRVAAMPAVVVEARRMFGLPDYHLRVQVADLVTYERWLMEHLMGDSAIARFDSRLTMKHVKSRP